MIYGCNLTPIVKKIIENTHSAGSPTVIMGRLTVTYLLAEDDAQALLLTNMLCKGEKLYH